MRSKFVRVIKGCDCIIKSCDWLIKTCDCLIKTCDCIIKTCDCLIKTCDCLILALERVYVWAIFDVIDVIVKTCPVTRLYFVFVMSCVSGIYTVKWFIYTSTGIHPNVWNNSTYRRFLFILVDVKNGHCIHTSPSNCEP